MQTELAKIKAEEQRYIKLYGSGIISEEQVKEAIGGLRLKRAGLERQVSRAAETKAQTDSFPLATVGSSRKLFQTGGNGVTIAGV